MSIFTSTREKRLWICVFVVWVAIFSTLFVGHPLLKLFGSQDIQGALFMLGMLLVGATVLVYGFRTKPNKIELTLLLGIAAVYLLLFLRLGLPERSHLIEYSVLTIFIHSAFTERVSQGRKILLSVVPLSFSVAFLIGVLDECIQLFLPNRVFDPTDIAFNGIAVFMAIAAIKVLNWARTFKIR